MTALIKKYGTWALITGASSGIGRSFALRLASLGFNCVLTARRENKLQQLATAIKQQYNTEVRIIQADLTDQSFLQKIIKKTSGLDIGLLINNAGFGSSNYFIHTDAQRFVQMIQLNCLAPVILTRHFALLMAERKRGGIIFVSSIGANQPAPRSAVYAATKVFDKYLGDALYFELKSSGIDVLTVLPGTTKTEFQNTSQFKAEKKAREPMAVVNTSLKALGKKPWITDGLTNKIKGFLIRSLPTKLKLILAHMYMTQRSTV